MTLRSSTPLPVAVLGATSPLGQHLVARLAAHPWFDLVAVAESHVSPCPSTLTYARVVEWSGAEGDLPAAAATLPVLPCDPAVFPHVKLIFSALSTPDAGMREAVCAEAGMAVIRVSGQGQRAADVPLLLPSVNPDHADALHLQRKQRAWSGWIVANPHPAAAALAHILGPLQEAFGLEQVSVTPWHAFPEPHADQMTGERVSEARQIERETRELLGCFDEDWGLLPLPMRLNVSEKLTHAQAFEMSVRLASQATSEDLLVAWELGSRQRMRFPSAPAQIAGYRQPLWFQEIDQKRKREIHENGDMALLHLGQLQTSSERDFTFRVLAPNPLRSVARHTLWQAEYLLRKGYIERWNWLSVLAGRRSGEQPHGRSCA